MIRKYVIEALEYILKSVISKKKADSAMDVLRALPLYHFLNDDSTPYEFSVIPITKIKWGDPALGIVSLQMCMESHSSG